MYQKDKSAPRLVVRFANAAVDLADFQKWVMIQDIPPTIEQIGQKFGLPAPMVMDIAAALNFGVHYTALKRKRSNKRKRTMTLEIAGPVYIWAETPAHRQWFAEQGIDPAAEEEYNGNIVAQDEHSLGESSNDTDSST